MGPLPSKTEEMPQYEHYFVPRRGGFAPQAKTNIMRKSSLAGPLSGGAANSQAPNQSSMRHRSLLVNPNKMPFIKNYKEPSPRMAQPQTEPHPKPASEGVSLPPKPLQPKGLMNNGRIIMGSFGVTNPLMSKTATHSRFMTATSAVSASLEGANQIASATGDQPAMGFGGLRIGNAHAT